VSVGGDVDWPLSTDDDCAIETLGSVQYLSTDEAWQSIAIGDDDCAVVGLIHHGNGGFYKVGICSDGDASGVSPQVMKGEPLLL